MQERNSLGLCYKCDEKYVVGHRYATRRYLIHILDLDENFEMQETQAEHNHLIEPEGTYFHLSLKLWRANFPPKPSSFMDLFMVSKSLSS